MKVNRRETMESAQYEEETIQECVFRDLQYHIRSEQSYI